jgi:hypothetical protein
MAGKMIFEAGMSDHLFISGACDNENWEADCRMDERIEDAYHRTHPQVCSIFWNEDPVQFAEALIDAGQKLLAFHKANPERDLDVEID